MYIGVLIICVAVAIEMRYAVVKHTNVVIGCLAGLFMGFTLTVCVNAVFWAVGSDVFRAFFTDTVELDSHKGKYMLENDSIYTWYEKKGGDTVEHAYKQDLDLRELLSDSDSRESMDDMYNAACKTNTSIVYTNDEPHCEISYSHAVAPEWYKFFSCFKVDDTYEDIHFTFYLPKKSS